MTTLRRLAAAPGIGLRLVAGGGDEGDGVLDRPVTWVAVSELPDPTPYLEGGELVLLTGVGLRLGAAPARAYVGRLVERGVAAAGFGVGVVHDTIPAGLLAAADAQGMPLFEVDRPTPFVAIGKALADLLAREQAERGQRRAEAMRVLTATLAAGAEPLSALRRLAGRVGGWVAVLDARGDVALAAGAPARPDVAAALAGQLRGRGGHAGAAASDATGRTAVLPLGLGERAHGYLAVATGPGRDADPSLVAFAASLLTLDRERSRGARPALRWARAAVLADRLGMPLPAPPADLLGPLGGDAPVVAVHLRGAGPNAGPVDAPVLGALDDEDRVLAVPDAAGGVTLVVAEPDAAQVVADLSRAAGVRGGVAAPVPGAQVADGVREAVSLAARSRAGLLHARDARPTLPDLIDPAAAQAFAAAVLQPLDAAGADADLLVGTLGVWLAGNGETGTAAAALGVHRHTLRDRLRRAAALLDADLDDPAVRADLWVALGARGALPGVR